MTSDSPENLHVCFNTITDHAYQILLKKTQLRGLTRRSKRLQFHCNAQKKLICKERRPFRHVQTLHDGAHSINQVPHYVSPGSRNVVDWNTTVTQVGRLKICCKIVVKKRTLWPVLCTQRYRASAACTTTTAGRKWCQRVIKSQYNRLLWPQNTWSTRRALVVY